MRRILVILGLVIAGNSISQQMPQ
ncbi:MAG: hypothetical protein RI883_577, partial [Bacteroidota bacterium]